MDDEDRASVLSMLAVSAKDMTFTNTDAGAIDAIIESAAKALAARKYTDKLASLYVDGAKSLFLAYDSVSDVTVGAFDANGDATWYNLVDGGKNATVDSTIKTLGVVQSYATVSDSDLIAAGYTKEIAHEFHTVEYDEGGTPVALRTVTFYHAYKDNGDGTRSYYVGDGSNTSAIKIKGEGDAEAKLIYLVDSCTNYRRLEPTTDGSKLYIKETNAKYVGKETVTLTYTNGGNSAAKNIPYYELGTGTGAYTWTYLATEATEGYTLLGNYKIGEGISENVGGWQLANGGLTMEVTDIMYSRSQAQSKLNFGAMGDLFGYAEDTEFDYTLEVILDYGKTKEQDNYLFSVTRTLYEGECAYQVGFRIGSWVEYDVVFPPEFAGNATDGWSNVHFTWQYGAADAYSVSDQNFRFDAKAWNTKNVSGIANQTYFKNREVIGVNVNGANRATVTLGTDKYFNGVLSEYGPIDVSKPVQMMYAMPGTVYAVRAYDFVLNEEQVAQNHFADLCAYFSLDVDALALLDADAKKDLYEEFSVYTFQNATKDELQALLDAKTASISPLQYLGVAARLEDYAAIRGTFYYNTDMAESLTANGMQIIGYGAAVALADVGMSELTVSYDEKNGVTSDNAIAVISTLDGMSFNYENQDYGNIFTLAVTYGNVADTALKAAYETEILYRGFLILADEAGVTYILYTNGTTDTYGDAASVKDVAESLLADPAYAENEILKGIVAVCEDEPLE